jgi:hypothetical protein
LGLLVLYLASTMSFQILPSSLQYLLIQEPNRHRLTLSRSGIPRPPNSFFYKSISCLQDVFSYVPQNHSRGNFPCLGPT